LTSLACPFLSFFLYYRPCLFNLLLKYTDTEALFVSNLSREEPKRMDRLHSCFIDVWCEVALESIYDKYLECSYFTKQRDTSALANVIALFPLLPSTLIWLSNQTMNGMDPFYSTLQPNKKCSGSVLIVKHKMKLLYSQKLEWSRSIPIGSPTKRTLKLLRSTGLFGLLP
jgi:hypothetical protein